MPVTAQRNYTPFYPGKYDEKMHYVVISTEPQKDSSFDSPQAMKTKTLLDFVSSM